jgi:citrate lyase subunit beta/citryl-CoA lyase
MNGRGTAWFEDDLEALSECKADYIILPKVETPEEVREVAGALGKPLLAMIETASGVLHAPQIAPLTAGLVAGTNDLSADLGIPLGTARAGLAHSLQMVVLAARAAGVAAFDGVHNGLDDEEGLARQCEEGKAFGFDGKSLIHPSQIATTNRIFGPSAEEMAAAERLIAAATGGAERHEGRMIESMHVDQARALLARARR